MGENERLVRMIWETKDGETARRPEMRKKRRREEAKARRSEKT
jgi:hypothetical protein